MAIEKTGDWRLLNKIVTLAPSLAVRIRPNPRIDRNRADFSFANFNHRRRDVSHKELVDINRLIVRCAEDAVFYQDDFAWVRQFIAKHRHYRIEPVIRKLATRNSSPVVSIFGLKIAQFPR